jgi:Uma2 family endonuclease
MNAITRIAIGQARHGPSMSVDQFFGWPGDGTGRHYQLIDGELVAMAPAAYVHGYLQAELARLIGNHLRATRPGCHVVVTPGVIPRANPGNNVRISDLVVSCGQVQQKGPVPEPVVAIEILSPSNEKETREAVRACLSIPSLQEVVILGSEERGAEIYRRDPQGHWPAEPDGAGPDDGLVLSSIGFRVAMADLYAGSGVA